MSLLRRSAALCLAAFLTSCSAAPFRPVHRTLPASVDAATVPERFARRLPSPLRAVHSVTFEYAWQSFTALGITEIRPEEGTFAIVGLHPTGGVKLFEIAGNRDGIERAYVQPQIAERGDLGTLVADDTRRIFLDRVPPADATAQRDGEVLRFRRPAEGGTLEFVFTGEEPVLIEKRYVRNETPVWSVGYHEYREEADGLHPGGIVFDHHDYGYRLILRFKEVL